MLAKYRKWLIMVHRKIAHYRIGVYTMSLFVTDLARNAVSIIHSNPPTEPMSLASFFSDEMGKIIDLVGADFELWLIVLNIVQEWLVSDPERFGEAHRFLTEGVVVLEGELPGCIDPVFWKLCVYQRLHSGRRDLAPV